MAASNPGRLTIFHPARSNQGWPHETGIGTIFIAGGIFRLGSSDTSMYNINLAHAVLQFKAE